MTQIDLPQLSLQRYADLLRRRRWQLVPIVLVGLVVGAVIAYMIPRYYVAEALVEHQEIASEMTKGENPFARIVDSAEQTIKLAVGEAMAALKWPEAALADPARRLQEEAKVRARLRVWDSNAGDRTRTYALIRVEYRDTDGRRAADFANALVDSWIAGRVAKLRSSHAEQLQLANTAFSEWDRTYEQYLREKQELEVRYRIRPDLDPRTQQDDHRLRQAAHLELRQRGRDLAKECEARGAEVEQLRAQLALVPERTQPTAIAIQDTIRVADAARLRAAVASAPENAKGAIQGLTAATLGRPEIAPLLTQLQVAQAGIAAWKVGTRERARLERDTQRLLLLVCAALGITLDADGTIPNPAHSDIALRLTDAIKAASLAAGELQRVSAELAAEARQIEDFAEGFRLLESKRKDVATAEQKRSDAATWAQNQSTYLAKLEQRLPVQPLQRATPPPTPTDPNILVVSLIGAVLGLGIAIGLVLLMDLLQGTFKTMEEVERALGLPVLGGLSHMETDAERTVAHRSRRRAGFGVFALMALVVLVVVTWYRAPTRLPGFVRDLLTLLLGN